MAATDHEELIADEADLEAFMKQPVEQRQLTARLKGVLAETACTGVIRYKWALIQPLLVNLIENKLKEFESAEHVDVGPARPLLSGDDSVAALSERFASMLWAFQGPPWTLQRLCELLLEPRKQYQRLHKLALALEKLLLVTGELDVSPTPGPLPHLGQFSRINEAPPAAAAAAGTTAAGQKRQRPEDADAGGLVAAALTVKQQPGDAKQQQQDQQASTAAGVSAAGAAAAGTNAVDAPGTTAMEVDNAPSSSDSKTDGLATAGDKHTEAAAAELAGQEAATETVHVTADDASDQPGRDVAGHSTANAVVS